MMSGYRNKDTLDLEITINYSLSLEQSVNHLSGVTYDDFRVVMPMSEISSARIFHPEVYELFQREGLPIERHLEKS